MKKIKCATVSHVHADISNKHIRQKKTTWKSEREREKMEKKEEVFEVMAIFSVFRNLTE